MKAEQECFLIYFAGDCNAEKKVFIFFSNIWCNLRTITFIILQLLCDYYAENRASVKAIQMKESLFFVFN